MKGGSSETKNCKMRNSGKELGERGIIDGMES